MRRRTRNMSFQLSVREDADWYEALATLDAHIDSPSGRVSSSAAIRAAMAMFAAADRDMQVYWLRETAKAKGYGDE